MGGLNVQRAPDLGLVDTRTLEVCGQPEEAGMPVATHSGSPVFDRLLDPGFPATGRGLHLLHG